MIPNIPQTTTMVFFIAHISIHSYFDQIWSPGMGYPKSTGPVHCFGPNQHVRHKPSDFTHVWVTRPFSEWLDKFSRYHRFFLVGNPPSPPHPRPKQNRKNSKPQTNIQPKIPTKPPKKSNHPHLHLSKTVCLPTPRWFGTSFAVPLAPRVDSNW